MSNQIKEDKMGGACGMHGRENNVYRVLVGKPWERAHLEGLGEEGRIVLK